MAKLQEQLEAAQAELEQAKQRVASSKAELDQVLDQPAMVVDAVPQEQLAKLTADLAAAYGAAGYAEGRDFHYVVQHGAIHNEVYWAMRLPAALRFLLAPRERALP